MKKYLSLLFLFFFFIVSCKKNSSPYDYNVNTTDPSALLIGTFQADLNGKTVKFGAKTSADMYFYFAGSDSSVEIYIHGSLYQSADSFETLGIKLNTTLPFDTATFYSNTSFNNNGNSSAGNYAYDLSYLIYTRPAYALNRTSVFKATITHIDQADIQGTFSGYAPPYNITNGGFNLPISIPASMLK